MDQESWTAIATAIAVPLAIGLLMSAGARATVPSGTIGYSRALKLFALVSGFLPPLLLSVLLAVKGPPAQPGQLPALIVLFLFFPFLASPLLLEFFRVRHSYDDQGLEYHSPWSKHRQIRWSAVAELHWGQTMKWLDLRTSDGVVIHISPFLTGLDGFARVALARVPAEVVACSPSGNAVLQLMVARQARGLMMSPLSPERALDDLRAKGIV